MYDVGCWIVVSLVGGLAIVGLTVEWWFLVRGEVSMTAICRTPHRCRAEMHDGEHVRSCQLQVGADLKVQVIKRRSTGYVELQPIGDPLTRLLVAHVVFAQCWEAL